MSPQNCGTLNDRGLCLLHICIYTSLLVGGKSKSFSKFEYLLEFLNKENYDFNFTSWLRFDKGDATKSTATNPVLSQEWTSVPPLLDPPLNLKTLFCLLPS